MPPTSKPPASEVLDAEGHKTGQILDRADIHAQQLWHEVVHVWMLNSKGQILMQLRAPGVELSPNVWDVTVGTHLRPNEAPTDAALRCLSTELGLTFAVQDLKHLFNMQCSNPLPSGRLHNVFEHVFMVQSDIEIGELQFDPAKVARFAWLDLDQLMADIGGVNSERTYLPRAKNYYTQLFEAFQSLM